MTDKILKAVPSPGHESKPARVPEQPRKSAVAKVSHTLSVSLAERLEEFAFFQRISESAVIEHSLRQFFAQSRDDAELGDILRSEGAGRRRKS
ncbi:MAG: hypothetical protein IAI49_15185 [Candidatus Eremiobacteraeota bacterium]|nr:hypothetical protein [Candidatus Eremiobacteraeota bacterium]